MTTQNTLHYQYQKASDNAQTMVFLHGLFGDLNNLGGIAKAFADDYAILRIDIRNHGQSFHADEMNYAVIADDLNQLFETLNIRNAIVVGHSMGGKSAMALAHLAPEKVAKLVVIDIAPVVYPNHRHDTIFAGLFAVKQAMPTTRQQAKQEIAKYIHSEGVQQFMLKSFDPQRPDYFKFNLSALHRHYANLMDWQPVKVDIPTLFIKGELSDYLQDKDTQTVLAQFPNAKLFIVANTDHWVHAEKPDAVIRAIQKFIGSP